MTERASPAGTPPPSPTSTPSGVRPGAASADGSGPAEAAPAAGPGIRKPAPLQGASRRIANAVTGARSSAGGSVATATPRERPSRGPTEPAGTRRGPRRARLALRRIDPWSVLKVAFLLSLAMLVVLIVAVGVLYLVLDTLGVFSSIDSALQQVSSSTDPTSVTEIFSFPRVIGGTAVIGAVNVLLTTALATLGAFLYNLCASIAGGIELTLTE